MEAISRSRGSRPSLIEGSSGEMSFQWSAWTTWNSLIVLGSGRSRCEAGEVVVVWAASLPLVVEWRTMMRQLTVGELAGDRPLPRLLIRVISTETKSFSVVVQGALGTFVFQNYATKPFPSHLHGVRHGHSTRFSSSQNPPTIHTIKPDDHPTANNFKTASTKRTFSKCKPVPP